MKSSTGRRLFWVRCGRRPGKNFLTFCSIGRVRSRVRPVDAAGVAAGPNALRGSGPNRSHALESALTQAGSPVPRNDRICITSSCPRQLVLPRYPNGLSAMCPIYPHRDRRTNIARFLKRANGLVHRSKTTYGAFRPKRRGLPRAAFSRAALVP